MHSETGMQRVVNGVVEKQIRWNVFGVNFWVPVENKCEESAKDETLAKT